jgi:hypothetical protein
MIELTGETLDDLNDWTEMLLEYSDIFMTGYCGYWLMGVDNTEDLGYLCYEFEDESAPMGIDHPDYVEADRAWRAGEALPKNWHVLNKQVAAKAFVEGVKKYGVDWYQNGDSESYDYVMQMALLGEIVYG